MPSEARRPFRRSDAMSLFEMVNDKMGTLDNNFEILNLLRVPLLGFCSDSAESFLC
jgi:hypothetical protein